MYIWNVRYADTDSSRSFEMLFGKPLSDVTVGSSIFSSRLWPTPNHRIIITANCTYLYRMQGSVAMSSRWNSAQGSGMALAFSIACIHAACWTKASQQRRKKSVKCFVYMQTGVLLESTWTREVFTQRHRAHRHSDTQQMRAPSKWRWRLGGVQDSSGVFRITSTRRESSVTTNLNL